MKKERKLEEEVLNLVSGGVLQEGWDTTLLTMMAVYKGKFGENGKQMVTNLFVKENIGEGPLEEADLPVIHAFIEDNWNSVEPRMMP